MTSSHEDILSALKKGASFNSMDNANNYSDLKWSVNDPKDAPFSDCSIHVKVTTSCKANEKRKAKAKDKINIYYAHQNILAVGQRRSEYFQQCFQTVMKGGQNGKKDGSVSIIELTEEEAKMFPIILKFHVSRNQRQYRRHRIQS